MFLIVLLAVLILVIAILCLMIGKIVSYADTSLQNSDKYREYFSLLTRWLQLRQNNISIASYLAERGYKQIAVYGMGAIGFRLCDELKDTDVCVDRTIDRLSNTIYHPLGVWNPETGLKDLKVDAVIITVNPVDCESIRFYMDNKEIPLLEISDIIYSI